MDIKFLTQENEIQKLYSKFGLVVPVGDLETGKAPAIQPLPAEATQTSVTFNFNVMSGADITAIEYKVNDGEAVSVTPKKGVVTVELSDLEYNSGPYEIELTVTNETGDTSVTQTADLVPYTDWATANEVLEGNKFIGGDGQEAVGTYVPEEVPEDLNYLGIPVFEYSVSEDPETGENVIDYARLVEGSHIRASEWAEAGLGAIDSYQIWYRWTTNDGQGNIDGTLLEWIAFESIDNPEATYIDLSSVLDADALANDTYFLEAYEIIRYNGIEYASECTTYPADVYEGGPVIESGELYIDANGNADVTGYSEVTVDVQDTANSANGICSQQFETALGYLFTGKIYNKTEGGADIQDIIDVYNIELYIEEGPIIFCNMLGFAYRSSENCVSFGFSTNEMPANSGVISGTGRVVFVSDNNFPEDPQNQYVADFNWTCDTGQSFYNLSNAVLTETGVGEYTFEMDSDSDMTDYEFTVLLYNTDGENTFYINMIADPNNSSHLITDPSILPLTPQSGVDVGDGGVGEIQSVFNNGVEVGPNPWMQYSVTPLT